ncbi:MAG TPA: hypothetical protein VFU76_11425 [Terriglobales bacterium]|nr:hypothetical protein [Terriglobales bacterium]
MSRDHERRRGDGGHRAGKAAADTVGGKMLAVRRQPAKAPLYLEEVRRFENCEYGLKEFAHREHLKVAWTYLKLYGYDTALVRMRQGLRRFSAHHGKMGYNETITVFWLRLLAAHLDENPAGVLRRLKKDELFRYFSRELAMSERAKREWVEPDLRTM